MNLQQIKTALNEGKRVFWKASNYEVIKYNEDYCIKCHNNGHCIGLTWSDGKTLNGEEKDFYTPFKVVGKKAGQLVDITENPMTESDCLTWVKDQGIESYYTNVAAIPYHGDKPLIKL